MTGSKKRRETKILMLPKMSKKRNNKNQCNKNKKLLLGKMILRLILKS